jgi:hypothetical protein
MIQLQRLMILITAVFPLLMAPPSAAESPAAKNQDAANRDERNRLRETLRSEIASLPSPDLEHLRTVSPWIFNRDPTKVYAFFPDTRSTANRSFGPATQAALDNYASSLFGWAKNQANLGNEGEAYMALFEVLSLSPSHAEAAKILGPTLGEVFAGNSSTPKVTRMRQAERTYGWPANTWLRVDSAHYTLISNANEDDLREITVTLERLYTVWDQVFFDYWAPDGRLRKAFQRSEPLTRNRTRKHAVVVFASRQDYVNRLAGTAPNIEDSKGYYAVKRRQSLFYLDESNLKKTWLHEGSHQLFQERFAARQNVGDRSNFWLVEGIAMFMESLSDEVQFATVGGMFSERLQFARFNLFTRQFLKPIEELCELGQQDFQADPRVRQLYSESAGVAQWLMTGDDGKSRTAAMNLLKRVYQSNAKPLELLELMKISVDDANRQYISFVRPRKSILESHPPAGSLEGLCLAYGDIDDTALENLKLLTSLNWLDLSESPISDQGLRSITHIENLNQLFLAGTAVSDAGVLLLSNLGNLRELDVSGTRVSNKAISSLSRLSNLSALSIANTDIDDAGVSDLLALPSLQSIDITGSKISPQGKQKLQTRIKTVID